MDWDRLFKKYVWDDVRTPYFFPVAKLNRTQANYELLAYSIFLGVLFGVVAVVSLSPAAPYGRSMGVSFYAMTVACTAIILGMTKTYVAALYLSVTPLSLLMFLYTFGFAPRLGTADKVFLLVFVILWLRYSWRVLNIAKIYNDLPDPSP